MSNSRPAGQIQPTAQLSLACEIILSNKMARVPAGYIWHSLLIGYYKSQNSLQQLGCQSRPASTSLYSFTTKSHCEFVFVCNKLKVQPQGKNQVMTRKGKKTWNTFCVARQWQARSSSLCFQVCILPIH